MKGAPDTPNVVEACNLEGRQERLDGLLSQLEMCEKALQVCSFEHHMCIICSNVHHNDRTHLSMSVTASEASRNKEK